MGHRQSSMARLTQLLVCLVAAMAVAFVPVPTPFARNAIPTALSAKGKALVKVEVGEGEPIESALRRFKREVTKSGHLMELRHRRYFENSQEKKKRKIKEGRMRIRLERMLKRRNRD